MQNVVLTAFAGQKCAPWPSRCRHAPDLGAVLAVVNMLGAIELQAARVLLTVLDYLRDILHQQATGRLW